MRFFDLKILGNATGGATEIYAWGVQIEKGNEVTSPVIRTTTIGSGAPRYSHDPETLVPTGLYLEPAATNHQMVMPTNTYAGVTQNGVANVTNYVLPSDYDYYGTSSVLYSQDVTAPDGTDTTLKVAFSGLQLNVNHNYLKIGKATGTLNAGTYTFSFFIKSDNANVKDYIGPDYDGRAGGISHQTAQANPWVSGHGGPTNFKLIDYPNGWVRAYVTFELSATITNIWQSGIYWLLVGGNNQTAVNGLNFYLWGFQLEASSYPSSFIGSSVANAATTRAADVYTSTATTVFDRDGGNKEAFLSPTANTMFGEMTYNGNTSYPRQYEITSPNGESLTIFMDNGTINGRMTTQAALQYNLITGSAQDNTLAKLANTYQLNDATVAINGAVHAGDNTVALHVLPTDSKSPLLANIGNRNQNDRAANAPIKRITHWKTRLPDASLINITT